MLKILLTLFPLLSLSFSFSTFYHPVEAFSISLNQTFVLKHLKNNQMIVTKYLASSSQNLLGCQVIGSISQLNLQGNPELEFYFEYHLKSSKSILQVNIILKDQNQNPLSSNLFIVLDFIIAKFPIEYEIRQFNMTSFQEHVSLPLSRNSELLFFLNGWNNLSMSGNVTHSYQFGDNVCTVHYMSHEGEHNYMGWREGKDVLLYTIVYAPKINTLQKFKLAEKQFHVANPQGTKYFYGIKGALNREFVGSFEQTLTGVAFYSEKASNQSTYGLAYLPYPKLSFIDLRLHNSSFTIILIVSICITGSIVIAAAVLYILNRRWNFSNSNLVQQVQAPVQIEETSNSQLRDPKLSNAQYKMNTVEEVDQQLEGSLRGSCNPKVGLNQNKLADVCLPE